MIDIYLKADASTWYYFSYFRGVMMTQSGNNNYNTIINKYQTKRQKRSRIISKGTIYIYDCC